MILMNALRRGDVRSVLRGCFSSEHDDFNGAISYSILRGHELRMKERKKNATIYLAFSMKTKIYAIKSIEAHFHGKFFNGKRFSTNGPTDNLNSLNSLA